MATTTSGRASDSVTRHGRQAWEATHARWELHAKAQIPSEQRGDNERTERIPARGSLRLSSRIEARAVLRSAHEQPEAAARRDTRCDTRSGTNSNSTRARQQTWLAETGRPGRSTNSKRCATRALSRRRTASSALHHRPPPAPDVVAFSTLLVRIHPSKSAHLSFESNMIAAHCAADEVEKLLRANASMVHSMQADQVRRTSQLCRQRRGPRPW